MRKQQRVIVMKFYGFFEKKWWRERESNPRHKDFQSFALPTELSSHNLKTRCLFKWIEL